MTWFVIYPRLIDCGDLLGERWKEKVFRNGLFGKGRRGDSFMQRFMVWKEVNFGVALGIFGKGIG